MHGIIRPDPVSLSTAARNLLCDCGGLQSGDPLVICYEDPRHGWYDAAVASAVALEAQLMGMTVQFCEVLPPDMEQPAEVAAKLSEASNIIYFARLGDQGRFSGDGGPRQIMVYARNASDLASDFGCAPHRAMKILKTAVDDVLFTARTIRITCPNGTLIEGYAPRIASNASGSIADVTTRRFPLGVPAPVPAIHFSGRVVLTDSLTPTGNRAYVPAVLPLSGNVTAIVAKGRITGFEGDARDVAAIRGHYMSVAERFGVDPFVVHSWHAGLHPGCRFFGPQGQNRDYWSNTVFSNPRMLHFHTCGTEAPGEISWNLVDATVTVDDVPLWENGVLRARAFPRLSDCLAAEPALDDLF